MIDNVVFRNTPYILQFLYEGQMFSTYFSAQLATGATKNIQLKTNSEKFIHLLEYGLESNSTDIEMKLIETPNVTDGDSEITIYNYDRRSSKTSDMIMYDNPTSVSGGEIISLRRFFGIEQVGGNASRSKGNDLFRERLLKKDSNYIIQIINNDDTTIDYFINLIWYESGN